MVLNGLTINHLQHSQAPLFFAQKETPRAPDGIPHSPVGCRQLPMGLASKTCLNTSHKRNPATRRALSAFFHGRVHAHAWDGMISAPGSFLWLRNTPPPSVCSSVAGRAWVVSGFLLLQVMLLGTFISESLCGYRFSILLGWKLLF